MKTIVRFTMIIAAVYLLSGCTRTYQSPGNRLSGSWVLNDAAQGGNYGWRPFYTGLENGVFDFYDNGSAVFTDQQGTMRGSWYVQTVTGGYYDEYGNYYTDVHQELQLQLSDPYTGSSINLYFNDVNIGGGQMIGTYYDGNYVVRYRFSRY